MRRAGVGAGLVLVLGVCAWGTSGAEQKPPAKPTPGQQKALQMLAAAGFGDVVVHDVPTDPMDAIFVTTRD